MITVKDLRSHCPKKYNDIDEVIIQQSYWNRFRVTWTNPVALKHYSLDSNMLLEETKGKIDCYNVGVWNDEAKSFDTGMITVKGDYAVQPSNWF